MKSSGLAGSGVGIRILNPDAVDFTGHARITRTWVQGFRVNFQCERSFIVTLDQVRAEYGGKGFYCDPGITAPAADGYVTTHLHINCYYGFNSVNIYYGGDLHSVNILFLGGSSEGSTAEFSADGSSYAACFSNQLNLHFVDWYCENQPGSTVILSPATATFDGLYLNNTGGIYIGHGTRARFNNVVTTSQTDVLSGGDGSQTVMMENCSWPASGNSSNFASLILLQSTINGTFQGAQLPNLLTGSGSPEGNISSPIGTLYLRTDGQPGTTLYVKESGTGTSGWVGK